jgi:hypothetical protein
MDALRLTSSNPAETTQFATWGQKSSVTIEEQ